MYIVDFHIKEAGILIQRTKTLHAKAQKIQQRRSLSLIN